jgi:hypothetical protein
MGLLGMHYLSIPVCTSYQFSQIQPQYLLLDLIPPFHMVLLRSYLSKPQDIHLNVPIWQRQPKFNFSPSLTTNSSGLELITILLNLVHL